MLIRTLLILWFIPAAGAVSPSFSGDEEPRVRRFGEISPEDFIPPFDADSADAVVLWSYGEASVVVNDQGKLKVRYTFHELTLVLTHEGRSCADVAINLYRAENAREQIVAFRAASHNLEDSLIVSTRVMRDNIFEEDLTEHQRQRKFVFPAVRAGTLLEHTYVLESDFIYQFPKWQFQQEIPVMYSSYTASFPEVYQYKVFMRGSRQPDQYLQREYVDRFEYSSGSSTASERWHGIRHTWIMEQIVPIAIENFSPGLPEITSSIEIELSAVQDRSGNWKTTLYADWEDLTEDLLDNHHFGGYLAEAPEAMTAAQFLPSSGAKGTSKDRAREIYSWLRDAIAWDGNHSAFCNSVVRRVIRTGIGNSAEINLLLVSAYRKQGFQAYPVLLSTRAHGRPPLSLPLLSRFNHVLCQLVVNGDTLLLDASEPVIAFAELGFESLNGQGRRIDRKTQSWVQLSNGEKHSRRIWVKGRLSTGGELSGTYSDRLGWLEAHRWKATELEHGRIAAKEMFRESFSDWQVGEISSSYTEEGSSAAVRDFHFEAPAFARKTGPELRFNLSPGMIFGSNPFRSPSRVNPVDMGAPADWSLVLVIELPPGYAILNRPEDGRLTTPDFSAEFEYSTVLMDAPDRILISTRLQIHESRYTAEEYPALFALTNQAWQKWTESFVIAPAANSEK